MVRSFILLVLGALFVSHLLGQRGTLDPAFEKIPFNRWLQEHEQTHFRWTASVSHAELSFHQRLGARVEIKVDGRDLETRRHDDQLVFFIQLTDHDGTLYQDHGSIELSKLDPNVKAANLEYSQGAFFLPGDYRLAVAILDSGSGEHNVIQAQFRIAALQHDSYFTEWWHDLPPVEFVGKNEVSPDSWYLPDIKGRLQWAASVHSPVLLNVILNIAASAPALGSRSSSSGDLSALLPTLKVIAQNGSSSLSEHIKLLDLGRRRAVFNQEGAHDLDWTRLKASLREANTASIDVHSLSERHHDAQFFVSEVRSLVRASEKSCVLVVLTKAVAFESGEDLDPISLEALPSCRVFYVRYRAPTEFVRPFGDQMGGRGRGSRMGGGGPMIRNRAAGEVDQLEGTLKPLSPKVFDVETPGQITKALVEIEKALLAAAQ